MNPSSSQAKEMADESMVRNLAAQAEAIWPQEEPIFDRHPLGDSAVLDVGCGTGFPSRFGAAVGCDMHVGRKTYTLLHDLGMAEIAVDYIVLDTLRVARDTFARIWEAWRDGYTESLVEHSGASRGEIEQRWWEMIDCARDPRGYALWQVPVWTAVRPSESVG